MAKKSPAENWTHIANNHAGDCFINYFLVRRGVYYDKRHRCIVIFSNNPYRENQWRLDELSAIRAALSARGLNELSIGFYPPDGDDARYTYAMLVDAPESQLLTLADLQTKAIEDVFRDLPVLHQTDPKEADALLERLSKQMPNDQ